MDGRSFRGRVLLVGALVAAGLGLASPSTASATDVGAQRLAGTDRVLTAVAISQARWSNDSAPAAVLARADAFPDALAGSPFAVAKGGPLLLTGSGGLDSRVEAELQRALAPGATVFLLGGTAALGTGVEQGLSAAGFAWQRVAGTDRFGTATAIAGALGHRDTILFADGMDFRDALIASASAPEVRAAVLLVAPGQVPTATAQYLAAHPPARTFAIGAVASAVVQAHEEIAGATAAATSVAVAERFFRHPDRVGIATSAGFADALGGGAHIGGLPGPLLLVDRDSLGSGVEAYLGANAAAISTIFAYGGTAVISDPTASRAAALARSVEGFAPRLDRTAWSYAQGGGVESPTVGEWPIADERWFIPGRGTVRAAMLFVDFPDAVATNSPQVQSERFVSIPPPWIAEVSYGRMTLDIVPVHEWYRMSKPVAQYGVARCCAHQPVVDLVAEATALADADVDFSEYDAVWVFGPDTQEMSPLLYRAFPGKGVVRDGRELLHGVISNGNLNPDRAAFQAHGIVTHEFGHLLGLPDLYGRTSATSPDTHDFTGGWEMMDLVEPGAHFLAFHKWLLGWLDPTQLRGLRSSGSVEARLTPIETPGGVKAVVVQVSPTKAYVAEVRRAIGEDDDICDEGVLIYTVDSTVINGQGPVRVKPSQASPDAAKRASCGPLYAAPFDLGAGEVATFQEGNVRFEVLEEIGSDYRVRATRT